MFEVDGKLEYITRRQRRKIMRMFLADTKKGRLPDGRK